MDYNYDYSIRPDKYQSIRAHALYCNTVEYMDLNNRARQNLDKLEDKPEKV